MLTRSNRKIPHTMSRFQKGRLRVRMRTVDNVLETLKTGLDSAGTRCATVEKVMDRTPKESEMSPKDKYWIFSRKHKGYRKSAHRQPKWTRITNRVPPENF